MPMAGAPPQQPAHPGGRLHGTDAPYQVAGRWYYPHAQPDYDEVGVASWYDASSSYNKHTADGEIFDETLPSAAHKTLPLPCIVEVTNLANGRRARVRVNDRGPFVDGRILDLSRAAAEELGYSRQGVVRVRVRYLGPAPRLSAPGLMVAAPPQAATPAPVAAPSAPVPVSEPELAAQTAPINTDPTARPDVAAASPSPASPLTPTPSSVAARAAYRVQAGAFHSRDSAERAAAQLADAGTPSIQPIERNGVTLYRVVVDGFSDRNAATGALNHIVNAGFTGARVVAAD
jgi:rare lipoprotein A